MNQYSPENRQQQNRNRKAAAQKEKKNILVIVAVLAAIIVIACAAFLINHFKANKAQETFATVADATVTQAVSETQVLEEGTDGPAGTTVTVSGNISVEDYSATMYSNTVTLNVRSAPSTNSAILGQIGKDTPITVTGKCSNGWMRITFNGTTGYCSADYLTGSSSSASGSNNGSQSDLPYFIKVNRTQNIVIVYTKDANGGYTVPYKSMVCSVGLNNATPTGTFSTTDKYTWRLLSGNVYGQYATRISGHYLFHSVPYNTQSKSDLEYDEYNKLGQAASLGCIRLCVADAKWIYDNCPSGTGVTIYDSDAAEPMEKPTPKKIDTADTSRRGWDPTDPDSANPWNS